MITSTKQICRGALIAGLYVVLTLLANALGLASGAVQLRFSEALCVLPYFTTAAIPGLYVGCILANLFSGAALWDVFFGSLATLVGAFFAHKLRRHKWLIPLPTILANMLILPPVLQAVYGVETSLWFIAVTVGLGEILSVYVLGMPLLLVLEKRGKRLFE